MLMVSKSSTSRQAQTKPRSTCNLRIPIVMLHQPRLVESRAQKAAKSPVEILDCHAEFEVVVLEPQPCFFSSQGRHGELSEVLGK